MRNLDASYFPIMMNDVNNTFFAANFPEVVTHYGADVDFDFEFSISGRNKGEVFEFSMTDGILLGPDDDLLLMMDMTVKNSSMADREVCATFQLVGQAKANFTLSNIMVYPIVQEVDTDDVIITKSLFPMAAGKDLEAIFDEFFTTKMNAWNDKYANGWSLANIDPRLAMIGGLIKNITATPYVSDGWLYAGFSMYADNPISAMQAVPELQWVHDEYMTLAVQAIVDRFGVIDWLHSYEKDLPRIEFKLEPEPWMTAHMQEPVQDTQVLV